MFCPGHARRGDGLCVEASLVDGLSAALGFPFPSVDGDKEAKNNGKKEKPT